MELFIGLLVLFMRRLLLIVENLRWDLVYRHLKELKHRLFLLHLRWWSLRELWLVLRSMVLSCDFLPWQEWAVRHDSRLIRFCGVVGTPALNHRCKRQRVEISMMTLCGGKVVPDNVSLLTRATEREAMLHGITESEISGCDLKLLRLSLILVVLIGTGPIVWWSSLTNKVWLRKLKQLWVRITLKE